REPPPRQNRGNHLQLRDTLVFGTFSTRPIVFDVPPAGAKGKLSGSIFDLWYFLMEEIGPAGADEGKGAKYLELPPDSRSRPTPMRSAQSRCARPGSRPLRLLARKPAARVQGSCPPRPAR